MLGQTIPEQFATEGLLISYFLILVLALEIGSFFIVQKATRKERSPTWILTFSVTMFAFGGVYVMRALNDLAFSGSPAIMDALYQVDFIIISSSGVLIGFMMRIFFKNGTNMMRLLSIVVILLGFAAIVLSAWSMLVSWEYALVPAALASALLVPVASFPIYLLLQLAKRNEAGYRTVFIVILAGILLNFIGLALNFQRVQAILLAALATAYPVFKFIVLVVIIAGLAMITFGFLYIPPVDDFLWMEQIVALYVLDKAKRVAIFKKIYDQGVVDGFSYGQNGQKQASAGGASEGALVSGIGGITEILSETAAAGGKKVEFIDQGAVKLLLSYQGDLIFMLLVKQANAIFKYKLGSFKDEFLLFFGDMIARFADKPEKFLPAESIVTRIFGTAGGKRRSFA
ncbi:MAG: hypothetical protein GYA24_03135 [Candidatus Lokiarchaeota archaeon]|nr:hypothetical protein [Candidatus Lokiarchaeota archaeon]